MSGLKDAGGYHTWLVTEVNMEPGGPNGHDCWGGPRLSGADA